MVEQLEAFKLSSKSEMTLPTGINIFTCSDKGDHTLTCKNVYQFNKPAGPSQLLGWPVLMFCFGVLPKTKRKRKGKRVYLTILLLLMG